MSPDQPPIVVAALYKFVGLPDYRELQPRLADFCRAQGIKGTLLLAGEGINGTIAGNREGIDAVLGYLKSDPRLADLPVMLITAAIGEQSPAPLPDGGEVEVLIKPFRLHDLLTKIESYVSRRSGPSGLTASRSGSLAS